MIIFIEGYGLLMQLSTGNNLKLLFICEALRQQGGPSGKGNFVHIVPIDPAYKARFAGYVPFNCEK